jgi:hypothetical protein
VGLNGVSLKHIFLLEILIKLFNRGEMAFGNGVWLENRAAAMRYRNDY